MNEGWKKCKMFKCPIIKCIHSDLIDGGSDRFEPE